MRFDDLMDELLEEIDRDLIPAIEAEKLVARVLETEPGVLEEWLQGHSIRFTTIALGYRIAAQRRAALKGTTEREFQDAANAHEEGDSEPISQFAVRYTIDDDNTRRRVGDMTGADHNFVADGYNADGRRAYMLESFHRAIAKKIGKKRTAEVVTEEQYLLLYRSIVTKTIAA